MQVLRAKDHRVMPWKNGAGSTTEIAVFPEGAGIGVFDWRVSMAGVVEDGAFSSFPDIERTLAVLTGEGIVLSVEAHAPVRLTRDGAPVSFPGDIATSATLIDGPILDLNVMARRGRFTHRLTRHRAPLDIIPEADVTLVLSRGEGLRLGKNVLAWTMLRSSMSPSPSPRLATPCFSSLSCGAPSPAYRQLRLYK